MPAQETLSFGAVAVSDFHSLPSNINLHSIVPACEGFPAVNTTTRDGFAFIDKCHGIDISSASVVVPSSRVYVIIAMAEDPFT